MGQTPSFRGLVCSGPDDEAGRSDADGNLGSRGGACLADRPSARGRGRALARRRRWGLHVRGHAGSGGVPLGRRRRDVVAVRAGRSDREGARGRPRRRGLRRDEAPRPSRLLRRRGDVERARGVPRPAPVVLAPAGREAAHTLRAGARRVARDKRARSWLESRPSGFCAPRTAVAHGRVCAGESASIATTWPSTRAAASTSTRVPGSGRRGVATAVGRGRGPLRASTVATSSRSRPTPAIRSSGTPGPRRCARHTRRTRAPAFSGGPAPGGRSWRAAFLTSSSIYPPRLSVRSPVLCTRGCATARCGAPPIGGTSGNGSPLRSTAFAGLPCSRSGLGLAAAWGQTLRMPRPCEAQLPVSRSPIQAAKRGSTITCLPSTRSISAVALNRGSAFRTMSFVSCSRRRTDSR